MQPNSQKDPKLGYADGLTDRAEIQRPWPCFWVWLINGRHTVADNRKLRGVSGANMAVMKLLLQAAV
jgi:hypothetical protein